MWRRRQTSGGKFSPVSADCLFVIEGIRALLSEMRADGRINGRKRVMDARSLLQLLKIFLKAARG
jgi:hypothetical protein